MLSVDVAMTTHKTRNRWRKSSQAVLSVIRAIVNKKVVVEILTPVYKGDAAFIINAAKCPVCGEREHYIHKVIEEYEDSLEAELECMSCEERFKLYARSGELH